MVVAGWPEEEAEARVALLVGRECRPEVQVRPIHQPEVKVKTRVRRSRRKADRYDRKVVEQRGSFTKGDFELLLRHYGQCLRCGRDDVILVPDHIVPLFRGGQHAWDNIQPLCHVCNIWKGQKMIDYRVGRRRLENPSADVV